MVLSRLLLCSLCLALMGCGSEESPGDARLADSRSGDFSLTPDGPWGCSIPVSSGGAVACSFTWSCTDGERKINCGYDVVNNVYDCVCQNLANGKTEGTFSGPSQTCASGAPIIVPAANKTCGWKLP